MLQLHLTTAAASATTIHPGTASRWHRFDPSLVLERLRELIASVGRGEGIEVAGDIGVTSHAGDLLRRAAIPSRLVGSVNGRHAGIDPPPCPFHPDIGARPVLPTGSNAGGAW